ncbi:hypothetical protein BJ912DRAFT_920516 [Pholiota molesta]|nr:hypothetical protein BJ912DRAFT_920516 [Pholiota molesta]
MLLGQTPLLYTPSLQNNRVKQDIIHIIQKVKKESFPHGTNILGVIYLMEEDLKKPLATHCIHSFVTTPNSGKVILTTNPYLLSQIIHQAETIFVDTTFKCTMGALKEWEAVMWDREVQQDCAQYKTIFDELQRITLAVTNQPLKLKCLSRGGTLVSIGVDMELAQALAAGGADMADKP